MSIFKTDEIVQPAAQILADGFRAEANIAQASMIKGVYDSVHKFWFRNTKADGSPSATPEGENPQPTGPEILEALGADAAKLLIEAGERAKYVITTMTRNGIKIDQAKLAIPYVNEFNKDGSLKSSTLADWYVELQKAGEEDAESESTEAS